MTDWTDDTPRPLAEIAKLAFPDGTVDAGTLLRRARQGKLTVTRPGKAYMTTLRDVWAMVEACRVVPKNPLPPTPTDRERDMELASIALDAALALLPDSKSKRKSKRLSGAGEIGESFERPKLDLL